LRFVRGFLRNWRRARNAIAVVEVHAASVPFRLVYNPWDKLAQHGRITHPITSTVLFGPWLDRARRKGVKAVICVWCGISAEDAKNQYLPFWQPYHDLPAIWVAGEDGDRVMAAARAGRTAHLTLDATITPNATMEALWAVSPGIENGETILVVTHSDGTNVVEENGHIALLELARDVMAQPPQRTIVFVFTAGHLRIPAVTGHGQATSRWLIDHPDWWAGGPGHRRAGSPPV